MRNEGHIKAVEQMMKLAKKINKIEEEQGTR